MFARIIEIHIHPNRWTISAVWPKHGDLHAADLLEQIRVANHISNKERLAILQGEFFQMPLSIGNVQDNASFPVIGEDGTLGAVRPDAISGSLQTLGIQVVERTF